MLYLPPYCYKWVGYVQILAAALIWGSYGLFVRALTYPPELIVFFRFLFGFLSLLAMAAVTGNFYRLKPPSQWQILLAAGFINSFSWMFYTGAFVLTSVANAVFLLYTAPCFVVLLAPPFLKEPIEKRSIIALILCLAGTASIMGYTGLYLAGPGWRGDLLALVAGFTYAVIILILKRLPSELLGLTSNVYLSAVITMVTFPFAVRSIHLITLPGLLMLLALGFVQQGVASTLYHAGLGKVKAQQAGILTYLEPFSAVIFASLFLHEGLTLGSILGGILILTGGIIILLGASQPEDDHPSPHGSSSGEQPPQNLSV